MEIFLIYVLIGLVAAITGLLSERVVYNRRSKFEEGALLTLAFVIAWPIIAIWVGTSSDGEFSE